MYIHLFRSGVWILKSKQPEAGYKEDLKIEGIMTGLHARGRHHMVKHETRDAGDGLSYSFVVSLFGEPTRVP